MIVLLFLINMLRNYYVKHISSYVLLMFSYVRSYVCYVTIKTTTRKSMMAQEQMAEKEKNGSSDKINLAEIKTGSDSSEELVFVETNKTINTSINRNKSDKINKKSKIEIFRRNLTDEFLRLFDGYNLF